MAAFILSVIPVRCLRRNWCIPARCLDVAIPSNGPGEPLGGGTALGAHLILSRTSRLPSLLIHIAPRQPPLQSLGRWIRR